MLNKAPPTAAVFSQISQAAPAAARASRGEPAILPPGQPLPQMTAYSGQMQQESAQPGYIRRQRRAVNTYAGQGH